MPFLNNGNNGGGNPNHDESGKFSSHPGSGAGAGTNAPQNPDDALIDRSLASLIKHAKDIGVENPTPNSQWSDELGYQLMNDGVPPEKVGPLIKRFQARMDEQKMRSMGFAPDGGAEPTQDTPQFDTESYANMVLDERRTIPHYGQPGKDWESLRKKRVEMLRNEPNEKLEQIRAEVNGIAKKWSMANKNRGITNDELMALKSLFVDVNNELSRRRG